MVPTIRLSGGSGGSAVHAIVSFPWCRQLADARPPRTHHTRLLRGHVRSVGTDTPSQLHAYDVYAGGPGGRLVTERAGRQKVSKTNSQTIAVVHAQHDRAWSFV